jgi:DNA polymerase-3 subunit delta
MELLLSMTGTDMGNLRMELEKLITYTMGKDIVTTQDIETICTTQIANKIFDMVRAVTEKDQKKALDLYYDLLALKEPPMRILFLLSRQFKQLWEAKQLSNEGASQAEIASRVGVPAFAVRGLLSCARAYTSEELKMAVEDFIEAEEDVKTGRQNDVMSVELLIIKYSNPNNKPDEKVI